MMPWRADLGYVLLLSRGFACGEGNFPPENCLIDSLSAMMCYASPAQQYNLLGLRALEQGKSASDWPHKTGFYNMLHCSCI